MGTGYLGTRNFKSVSMSCNIAFYHNFDHTHTTIHTHTNILVDHNIVHNFSHQFLLCLMEHRCFTITVLHVYAHILHFHIYVYGS